MSFFCIAVDVFFQIPEMVLGFLFGLVGLDRPDLTFGIGSIFGCNL